ncbi:hypothetical protein C8J56DRAFT_1038224 [Mycena floridula]|nr:hypothetical protein C8J56DRAFT_1038224 [Mycena floridula]
MGDSDTPTYPELAEPTYLWRPQLANEHDDQLNVPENDSQNINGETGWSSSHALDMDHPSDLDVRYFGLPVDDSVWVPSNNEVLVALGQGHPGAAAQATMPAPPQETMRPRLGTFPEFISSSITAPSDHNDHTNPVNVISSSVPVPSKPFACKDCNQGFNREADLNRHFQSPKHAGQTGPQYICSRCNRRYWRKDSLQRHGKKTRGICRSKAGQQLYS